MPLPRPHPQLWEISSGELLLSVVFDVGIMAVTMDLAEHHMFCGGSDGSIFQVDLCTWVSDSGQPGGMPRWRLGPGPWAPRASSSWVPVLVPHKWPRAPSQNGLPWAALPGPLGQGHRLSLCSRALRPPQPGQREKTFQPEQDSGKVFKGHRCGSDQPRGARGRFLALGQVSLRAALSRPLCHQKPGDLSVRVHGWQRAALGLTR